MVIPSLAPARRSVVAAVAVATVCVLPAFLVGALAVQLRADLDFSRGALGLAPAVFFGVGAATSAAGGRLVERVGPRRAMRLAGVLTAGAMAGVAALATTWPVALGFLAIGGLANAIAQPGSNLLLARRVEVARRATAFAVKQSAIPAAMLLGGLAVPTLALTIGWRWAFAGGAVAALATTVIVPEAPGVTSGETPSRPPPGSIRRLTPLALGAGLGAAAANTLGTFLVESAVDQGLGEATAGLLFAFGATAGLGTRLAMGFVADRRGLHHEFGLVGAMLAGGALGYALLATGVTILLIPATLLAFSLGWGWPGLFNHSVVSTHPEAPGASTGITQTGVYIGAVTGPVVFGFTADATSFSVAWLGSLAGSIVAAVAVAAAGTRLDRRAHAPSEERQGPAVA